MESTTDSFHSTFNKTIYLLWFQGWDHAPWLHQQVAQSWKFHNPDWKVVLLDDTNVKEYVTDIEYIYDEKKNMPIQTKSDIVRISILQHYGGVWADATMLCMQPLTPWIEEAVTPAGFWMYHNYQHPAIWFIVAKKGNYCITQWKKEFDDYFQHHDQTHTYFLMDALFATICKKDKICQELWSKVPYLNCELDGQSHTLSHHKMEHYTPHIQELFRTKPPYALKLWKHLVDLFPDPTIDSKEFQQSNAVYAIEMSKRNMVYKHTWQR
jgi:Capsular polysaccharide synthesis protein